MNIYALFDNGAVAIINQDNYSNGYSLNASNLNFSSTMLSRDSYSVASFLHKNKQTNSSNISLILFEGNLKGELISDATHSFVQNIVENKNKFNINEIPLQLKPSF